MKVSFLNPVNWIITIALLIGMILSYVIGSWVFCPLLSAIERTKAGPGLPTPIFLMLFLIVSPFLFILWLESIPETIRRNAETNDVATI
ncbi:MAG: hypothetical protein HZC01_02025 [Candidatus Kerfeldbacteria bacterium]|nr:hypothetical protein [Candidatus Kerfeldbacteria bacterium]